MDLGVAAQTMTIAILLAVTNQKIIDFLVEPVRKHVPDLDMWWVTYLALLTGVLISLSAGVNLFVDFVPVEITGKVLTAVLIGGGSSLIHDIFDKA